MFEVEDLSLDLIELIQKYQQLEPILPFSRFKIITLSYYNFSGEVHHDGEIMVLDVIVESVINIFSSLYNAKFPINSINLIHHYKCDDEKSMEDNNSSAFNGRYISKTDVLSIHAYGLAIDINPLQNPMYSTRNGEDELYPQNSRQYLDRDNIRDGMVETKINDNGDTVVDLFAQNGFVEWGGSWNSFKDYHHFQLPRELADIIVKSNYEDGKKLVENVCVI